MTPTGGLNDAMIGLVDSIDFLSELIISVRDLISLFAQKFSIIPKKNWISHMIQKPFGTSRSYPITSISC